MTTTHRTSGAAALATVTALALAACANADDAASAPTATSQSEYEQEDHAHEATQAAARTPRIVLTYDGGLLVVDATSLETVGDLAIDGFNRINGVGDGRHVAVSTTGGWAVLDAGTWSDAHGDHFHYYTADPELHDVLVPAEIPGHVVAHDGLTSLFDDGTGDVTVVETSEWTEMVEHGDVNVTREYTTEFVHHGVAVASQDGTLLVTRGNDDGRTGAMLLDAAGTQISVSDECPGVHGETAFTAPDGDAIILTGCEDGALVFHGDHVHKLTAPDAFGRIGNAFSVDGSGVVLGDYKTDPEGGIGLTQITLIDIEAETITPVDPFVGSGAQYTWRGLARGADGEVLVLGTDGVLRVIDETTGEQIHAIDVIGDWEVPVEWQTAHPALTVLDGMAYVTEPSTGTLFAVDYVGGTVWKSVELGATMNEIVGVTG